jgi:5-methylcytosine-specific restriction endonuclease McrA
VPDAAQAFLLSMASPPWKAWYKTARWQALRRSVFLRDLYTCRKCGLIEPNTTLLVCDHKVPHRGNQKLFWDEGNLQALCKACHDAAKQAEEQASLHTRGVWY